MPINSIYAQQNVSVLLKVCPEDIFIGERHIDEFVIRNFDSKTVVITKLNFVIDGFENSGNNSIIFTNSVPTTLSAFTSEVGSIRFVSYEEGIHYVDVVFSYFFKDSSENVFEETSQICRFNVKPLDSLWDPIWLTVVIAAITSGFGSAAAYGLKRYFLKKDIEHQKQLDHSNWLLQQMHSSAEKYYFPLAKFSLETKTAISIASASKRNEDIENAYYKLAVLISKYLEFKENTGANFIFKNNKGAADKAINKTQAVFVSLPFDALDLNEIQREYLASKENKKSFEYTSKSYCSFKNWIKSDKCQRSRDNAMMKLFELQQILDNQGERISNPDFVNKLDSEDEVSSSEEARFWILRSSTKYAKQGDEIFVFGYGFNEEIPYKFHIHDQELQQLNKFKNAIRLKLPDSIPPDTYDVYSTFEIDEKTYETIGLVFHILKKK